MKTDGKYKSSKWQIYEALIRAQSGKMYFLGSGRKLRLGCAPSTRKHAGRFESHLAHCTCTLKCFPNKLFPSPRCRAVRHFFCIIYQSAERRKMMTQNKTQNHDYLSFVCFLFSADLINLLHVNCPGSVCDDISFSLAWLRFQHHLSLSG